MELCFSTDASAKGRSVAGIGSGPRGSSACIGRPTEAAESHTDEALIKMKMIRTLMSRLLVDLPEDKGIDSRDASTTVQATFVM